MAIRPIDEILRQGFPAPQKMDSKQRPNESLHDFERRIFEYNRALEAHRSMSDALAGERIREDVAALLILGMPLPDVYAEWVLFQIHSGIHIPNGVSHRRVSLAAWTRKSQFASWWHENRPKYSLDAMAIPAAAVEFNASEGTIQSWLKDKRVRRLIAALASGIEGGT